MEMTEALVKDEEDLSAQVLKVEKECWIKAATRRKIRLIESGIMTDCISSI